MCYQRLSLYVAAVLAVAVVTLTATDAVADDGRQFVHAQGVVTLPDIPRKVVVLDLAALDTLDALGIPVVGVPALREGMWPDYLKKYAGEEYAKVGSLFEPDLGAIRGLEPDLIIVGGRSRRALDDLSSIAPTMDLSTSTTGFIPSVVNNILTLGAIFEIEQQATATALQLLNDVRALHASAGEQSNGLLLFTVGEKVRPQVPATRFGIVYELVGIEPIVTPADAGPPRERRTPVPDDAPAEVKAAEEARQKARDRADAERLAQILARQPQWLFVIDRNSAFRERDNAADVLAATDDVASSDAWKAGRVIHLSGGGWYLVGGGVQQLRQTIARIEAAFEEAGEPQPR